MAAPSWQVLEARLAGAVGSWGLWEGALCVEGGASNQVLKVPSTPNHAVDPIPIPCSVRARRRGRGPLPTWCRCPAGRGGERHREQGGAGQEPRPARGQRDGADPPHHHPQLRRLVRLQQVRGAPEAAASAPLPARRGASPPRASPLQRPRHRAPSPARVLQRQEQVQDPRNVRPSPPAPSLGAPPAPRRADGPLPAADTWPTATS